MTQKTVDAYLQRNNITDVEIEVLTDQFVFRKNKKIVGTIPKSDIPTEVELAIVIADAQSK